LRGAFSWGRRASVGIWIAVMAPGLIMATSMAVEVGAWEAAQVSAQRAADLAATAGAANFLSTNNAQTAATFAARVAQLNGGTGTAAITWSGSCTSPCTSACTLTGTDNQITVQTILCAGYTKTSDPMIKVTVQKTIPSYLSAPLFSSATSHTVSATGTAELVTITSSAGGGGGQPCLLTLGTTGTNITVSGSAEVTGSSCVVRSDASIALSGSAEISASATYAAGSISTSGSASVTGTEYTSAGTIPDPYASYSPVQTALAELSSGGTAYSLSGSSTATISAGTYSSITVSGSASLTLNPGLYIVNGNVSVSGSGKITGNGVTIVTSGSFTLSGTAVSTISAPGTSPSGGAVSGFVILGSGSGTYTFSGSAGTDLTGVVYAPSGSLSYSGSAMSSPSSCLEFIVKTASLSGSATFSGGCSSFGAPSFSAAASTTASRLVN
jgi:hypothetical protein